MDGQVGVPGRTVQYESRCAYPPCDALERDKGFRFKQCNGCKSPQMRVLYCSQECQKSHWPLHKSQCRHIAKLTDSIPLIGGIDKKPSKELKALTYWRAAVRVHLIWATCEAFRMDPTIDPAHNYLRIDLEDFDGPHAPYIAPARMSFISKEGFDLWTVINQGVDVVDAGLSQPSSPPPEARVVFLTYKSVSILVSFDKKDQYQRGITGPFPSTRQWPLFLQMASVITQEPHEYTVKSTAWEYILHGWTQLGFEEAYPNLGEFSLSGGWVVNSRKSTLFKDLVRGMDDDARVSALWKERLARAAKPIPPADEFLEIS